MDKADIVCENTYTHNEQYLTVKKEERKNAICGNMDGP